MDFLASQHHKNQDIMWIMTNVDIGPEENFRANPSYTQKRTKFYQWKKGTIDYLILQIF